MFRFSQRKAHALPFGLLLAMGCRKQYEMEITRCGTLHPQKQKQSQMPQIEGDSCRQGTCSTLSLFFHIDIARSTPGECLGVTLRIS